MIKPIVGRQPIKPTFTREKEGVSRMKIKRGQMRREGGNFSSPIAKAGAVELLNQRRNSMANEAKSRIMMR